MNKLSKIFKTKGVGFIILAFAAGIILLMMPEREDTQKASSPSSEQYVSSLESSLEKLLLELCGKDCRVMITLESGYSYTYAADEKLDTVYGESGIASKTATKEYVTVSDDYGSSLVIVKENLPQVKGVAIVCKKGSKADEETVISIVCSLFDIPYENVGCAFG